MFRWLRNAFSALCVIACIVFVSMWVRSRWHADQLHGRLPGGRPFILTSKQGRVTIFSYTANPLADTLAWAGRSYAIDDQTSFPTGSMRQYESAGGFGWIVNPPFNIGPTQPTVTLGSTTVTGGGTVSGSGTLNIVSMSGNAKLAGVSGGSGTVLMPNTGTITITSGMSTSGSSGAVSSTTGGNISGSTGTVFSSTGGNSKFVTGTWSSGTISGGTLILAGTLSVTLQGAGLILPYWFLVLLSGAFFALSRLKRPWRFSLRSLLVTTTFVAIVLGLAVTLDA